MSKSNLETYLIRYGYPLRMVFYLVIDKYWHVGGEFEYGQDLSFDLEKHQEKIKDCEITLDDLPQCLTIDYDFSKHVKDIITIYKLN